MECKLFQTAEHEIKFKLWKWTLLGLKLCQQFFSDGHHWVTGKLKQAKIESTIYQRFGDCLFLRYKMEMEVGKFSGKQ